MEKLHTDIVENILNRLPIDTALQAKRVCKTWRILLRSKIDKVGLLFAFYYSYRKPTEFYYYGDLCNDPIRVKMHDVNSILDYSIGSCNGLVCFERRCSDRAEQCFFICNPLTGEVVDVPKTYTDNIVDWPWNMISGFGYVEPTNEYKIVSIRPDDNDPTNCHVRVYTVGGASGWRCKESIKIFKQVYSPIGIYENGALHWHIDHDTIIAFDLEDEQFRFFPSLRFEGVKLDYHSKLLGGNNLYFVYTTNDQHCMDIWAYKRKNSNTANACDKNLWHWVKELRIEWEEELYRKMLLDLKPMAITSNNEILLRYNNRAVYCYDPKTSTLNKLFDGTAIGCSEVSVIPHANSLVSLKDIEEV